MRPGWAWASASVVGTAHLKIGTRRQDACRTLLVDSASQSPWWVGIACDGAGSASHGGEGASLIARIVSELARRRCMAGLGMPLDDDVRGWLDEARDAIAFAARQRQLVPRDFAATMILVLSSGFQTLVAQVGDGCAALREASSTDWQVPLWPDHGEYASTTSFVTDDPEARLRVSRVDAPVAAVVMLTDGLERLALDFATLTPFAGFFDAVSAPAVASRSVGRDVPLSRQLADYLGGESICARTDDDKTLITAALR